MLINNCNNRSTEPSHDIEINEFNESMIQLGSFVSMYVNKRLNYISLIALVLKTPILKKLYMEVTGISSIYTIIQLFIQNTPNLHKKVAKRSLFQ